MLITPLFVLGLIASSIYPAVAATPDISNIRVSRSGDKQRVVIDINSDSESAFYVRKGKDSITLTMEAVMRRDKEDQFKKLLEKTKYIDGVSFINLEEEGEFIAELRLTGTVYDNVFTLSNPSRLVIDLDKYEFSQ